MYNISDHLAHLKSEREGFYASHEEAHLCCWHSIQDRAFRWKCCQCAKKVNEQWMDYLDYFINIGEVRA